jgi:hypothetical protein
MSDSGWRTRLRWVVVHPHDPKALMLGATGAPVLPGAELPGQVWTADATATVAPLREVVGFDAVSLCCVEEHEDPSAQVRHATLAAAPRGEAPLPPGAAWVGREELAAAAWRNEHAAVAAGVVDELVDGRLRTGRPPWALPGWFPVAEAWLRSSLEELGYAVTGPAQQVRVWELSCVLRAPTDRGVVYFKATADSPLFVNEGVVMGTLAGLFPDHVPAPLAVDAARGWMLLGDLGDELGWETPVERREDVLRAFARLQIEAVAHVDQLLGAGCLDRRPAWMAAEAEAWLPAIEATGRLPGIDAATWLSAGEIAELRDAAPSVAAICGELAAFAVPATLVHGDLHLSNVADGPAGYRYFDWTDACISHPFVDLLAFFHEDEEEVDGGFRTRLRDAYLAEWTSFEPAERLLRAWRLAEPLAAFHHAISYRSIVAGIEPPLDRHMAASTAYWLRKLLAGLAAVRGVEPASPVGGLP